MKNNSIKYDLDLVHSLYKSNNEILIRLTKRNLKYNKRVLVKSVRDLLENKKEYSDEYTSEIANIDWILLNSIYISLFVNFENHLLKLSKIVENRMESNITINDIKGNGQIDQYRKYMELVGNIKSAKKNNIWNEIDTFKLVRNKLVHKGGYLSLNPEYIKEKDNLYKFLIDNKVLLAGILGHIRIRKVYFLEKFIKTTSELSNVLKKEIEKI